MKQYSIFYGSDSADHTKSKEYATLWIDPDRPDESESEGHLLDTCRQLLANKAWVVCICTEVKGTNDVSVSTFFQQFNELKKKLVIDPRKTKKKKARPSSVDAASQALINWGSEPTVNDLFVVAPPPEPGF